MQMIRGAAALAAGVLMVGGLAACGDEGEPEESSSTASPSEVERTSSSESSSSSGSSSSGSSETQGEGKVAELPAAAKKRTKEGAIAFNKFYWEQRGEALKSGKTATLRKFSTSDCEPCNTYIATTEKNAKRGVTMDKNPNHVGAPKATLRDDGGFRVALTIEAEEYHEVLSNGERGRSADPITMNIVSDTQWRSGHWVIQDSIVSDTTESPKKS